MGVRLDHLSDDYLREWARGCRGAAEAERRGVEVLERRAEWLEAELEARARARGDDADG